MAVAVQCPAKDSSYGSGYCFAETTAVGEKIGMIPDLNAQNNQAQGVQKLDYFSDSQSQFDVKKLGPVEIFEKTSGQLYSGVAATMQLSTQIDTLGGWISSTRGQLVAQNSQINADRGILSGMEKDMQKFSKAKDYKNYNALVPKYNAQVEALQKEIASYNAQVNAYNFKVKQYNGLVASF
jgi:flagellar biosynthesis chaperone FliJ